MIRKDSFNLNDLERLERKYENQVESFPNSNAFILLAEILLQQKKNEKAIGVLIHGLKRNEDNITARFLLAKSYYESWNIDLAKKELEKVIDLAPDNYGSAKLLIEIYKSDNELEKALNVARNLLFYYPGDKYVEGQINELKGFLNLYVENQLKTEYDGNEFNQAEQGSLSSTNSDIYKTDTMVDIYFSQGMYNEAKSLLDILTKKFPENLDYQDKYQKALKYIDRNNRQYD